MSKIRITEDLWAPGVTRGARTLVGRAGQLVDEKLVAKYEGTTVPVAKDDASDEPAKGYDGMKPKDLRDLLDERGIDRTGLKKKQELIDALEDADKKPASKYADLDEDALREALDERKLDHSDLKATHELVEALEQHDEAIADYVDLNEDALRAKLDELDVDHTDLEDKADLVNALAYDDESNGS